MAEVYAKLLRANVPPAAIADGLHSLVATVVPFDHPAAVAAAALHAETRPYGLSLADCACLSLARALGRPAVTADGAWTHLGLVGLTVDVIR